MERLHVMHVIDQLGLGGAERMAVDLANESARRGHRVTMCVTRGVDTLRSELAPEIEVLHLGRRSRYHLAPVVRFVQKVRREAVDVLHVHMRSSMALVLPLRALRLVPPVVFHDHYGSIEIDTAVPRWFRIGQRWIDAYVGVSPALGAWARQNGVPAERVNVIENAIDLARLEAPTPARLRDELGLSSDTSLALIVATIRPDKGIETALAALAETDRRLHLAIAGTIGDRDYHAMLVQQVETLGLTGRVTFLGGRRDVPALLAASDLAISSSHSESGPLVLVEFAYAGTPFVATRVGDIGRRLSAAGIPGFVPPREPTAMAHAIAELLALDRTAVTQRTSLAREQIADFDIRRVFERWSVVYDRARGIA